MPQRNPELLPEGAMQVAQNVDVLGGALAALAPVGPFYSMHESTGYQKAGLTSTDVVAIQKPSAPTVTAATDILRMCKPFGTGADGWLTVKASYVKQAIDSDGTSTTETSTDWGNTFNVDEASIKYTPEGFTFAAALPGNSISLSGGGTKDRTWKFYGPFYSFTLANNVGNGYGGPAPITDAGSTPVNTITIPKSFVASEAAKFPTETIPLFYSGNAISSVAVNPIYYGSFQVVDVEGPVWDTSLALTGTDNGGSGLGDYVNCPGGTVTIHVRLLYVNREVRWAGQFSRTYVDSKGREGPPSDLTDMILVEKGQAIKLNLAVTDATYNRQRIYVRQENGEDDLLVQDIVLADSASVIDPLTGAFYVGNDEYVAGSGTGTWTWRRQPGTTPMPPFGNYGGVSSDNSTLQAVILAGSILHPSNYALTYMNKLTDSADPRCPRYEIRPSDVYRVHAFPDEFALARFTEPIKALVQVEGSTLAFIGDKVFSIGGEPGNMAASELCSTMPLLGVWVTTSAIGTATYKRFQPWGLCQVGNMVLWPTKGGIAATNGGPPRIITDGIYTAEQWQALDVTDLWSTAVGRSSDKSAYFDADNVKIKVDLAGEQPVVTTHTGTWDGVDGSPATANTLDFDASDASAHIWQSGRERSEQPKIYDWVRVTTTGTVSELDLTVYANDGVTYGPLLDISADAFVSIASLVIPPSRDWSWQLNWTGTGTITRIDCIERRILPVEGGGLRLTQENAPVWQDVWTSLKHDRFVAGAVIGQTNDALKISLLNRAGAYPGVTVEKSISAGSGAAFQFTRSATDNPLTDIVRVKLLKSDGNEAPAIQGLELFTRQPVQSGMVLHETGGVPLCPWWIKKYVFGQKVWIKSVQVWHNKPTALTAIKLYLDGGATAVDVSTEIPTMTSGYQYRIGTTQQAASIEFDFGSDDAYVLGVLIVAQLAQEIGDGGINITPSHPSFRGNLFALKSGGRLACGSVSMGSGIAADYDGSLKIYADGGKTYERNMGSTSPDYRHGKGFLITRRTAEPSVIEVDLDTTKQVNGIRVLTRVRTPIGAGPLHVFANSTGIPEWMWREYDVGGLAQLVSCRVLVADVNTSADYTNLKLFIYTDGKVLESVTDGIAITGTGEIELYSKTAIGVFSAFDFNFGGVNDHKVREVIFYFKTINPIGPEGVNFPLEHYLGNYFQGPGKIEMAAVAVTAQDYTSLTLNLSPDSAVVENGPTITDGQVVPVPRTLASASLWRANINTSYIAESLQLLPRQLEETGRVLHIVAPDAMLKHWLWKRFKYTEECEPISYYVKTKTGLYSSLYMHVYKNAATTPTLASIPITNGQEGLLQLNGVGLGRCSTVEFEFVDGSGNPVNHLVSEVFFFGRETIPMSAAGLSIRDGHSRLNWRGLNCAFKTTGSIHAFRVVTQDYTGMTLELSLRGASAYSVVYTSPAIANSLPVIIASAMSVGMEWTVDLPHAREVDRLDLYGRAAVPFRQLKGGGRVACWKAIEDPPCFVSMDVSSEPPFKLNAYRVVASSYPVTLNIEADGTAIQTITVNNAKAAWLPAMTMHRAYAIDVIAGDTIMIDSVAVGSSPQACNQG